MGMELPSRSPWLPLLSFTVLAATLPSTAAFQQEIECLEPHRMGQGVRPVYDTGETVQFQWKSTFPTFNLSIVQVNSATQMKTYDHIFNNEPNGTANYFWTAKNFAGLSQNDPFHLWIVNAEDKGCATCNCRSANFTVLNTVASPNASTTTIDSSSSATAPASSSASTSSSDSHLKLGLGLGLGLGIPLLVTLTALATWLCVRRRRQQQRNEQSALPLNGTFDSSIHPPHSARIPLASAGAYTHPSSLGYSSDPSEKSPAREADSQQVAEMQTHGAERFEAPQDSVRVELEGSGMGRKDEKRV